MTRRLGPAEVARALSDERVLRERPAPVAEGTGAPPAQRRRRLVSLLAGALRGRGR